MPYTLLKKFVKKIREKNLKTFGDDLTYGMDHVIAQSHPKFGAVNAPVVFYKLRHKATGMNLVKTGIASLRCSLSNIGDFFTEDDVTNELQQRKYYYAEDSLCLPFLKQDWEVVKFVAVREDWLDIYQKEPELAFRAGVEVSKSVTVHLIEKLLNRAVLDGLVTDHYNKFIDDYLARTHTKEKNTTEGTLYEWWLGLYKKLKSGEEDFTTFLGENGRVSNRAHDRERFVAMAKSYHKRKREGGDKRTKVIIERVYDGKDPLPNEIDEEGIEEPK